jgi:hypothetical protein
MTSRTPGLTPDPAPGDITLEAWANRWVNDRQARGAGLVAPA